MDTVFQPGEGPLMSAPSAFMHTRRQHGDHRGVVSIWLHSSTSSVSTFRGESRLTPPLEHQGRFGFRRATPLPSLAARRPQGRLVLGLPSIRRFLSGRPAGLSSSSAMGVEPFPHAGRPSRHVCLLHIMPRTCHLHGQALAGPLWVLLLSPALPARSSLSSDPLADVLATPSMQLSGVRIAIPATGKGPGSQNIPLGIFELNWDLFLGVGAWVFSDFRSFEIWSGGGGLGLLDLRLSWRPGLPLGPPNHLHTTTLLETSCPAHHTANPTQQ